MDAIATALARSSCACAPEAAEALRSGWNLSRLHAADAADLLLTYRIRHENLKSMAGPHAKQLADAVAELLPNLESRRIAKVCTLSGPKEYSFDIFLSEQESFVLGCLKTVSQLDVSAQRWEELWQGAV